VSTVARCYRASDASDRVSNSRPIASGGVYPSPSRSLHPYHVARLPARVRRTLSHYTARHTRLQTNFHARHSQHITPRLVHVGGAISIGADQSANCFMAILRWLPALLLLLLLPAAEVRSCREQFYQVPAGCVLIDGVLLR